MAKPRQYSDEERANALAALAANGGNINRTAKQLGIPEKTLSNWANGKRHPESAQMGERKKGDMSDALEALAWKLLDAWPKKIAKATLAQLATATGIAIDKMRLLREPSTAIAGGEMTDEERLSRLRELVERAKRRRLGLSDADGAGGVGSTGHPGLPPESDGVIVSQRDALEQVPACPQREQDRNPPRPGRLE